MVISMEKKRQCPLEKLYIVQKSVTIPKNFTKMQTQFLDSCHEKTRTISTPKAGHCPENSSKLTDICPHIWTKLWNVSIKKQGKAGNCREIVQNWLTTVLIFGPNSRTASIKEQGQCGPENLEIVQQIVQNWRTNVRIFGPNFWTDSIKNEDNMHFKVQTLSINGVRNCR